MRFSVFPLAALSVSTVVSAGLHPYLVGRDVNDLLRRQQQVPIPSDLTTAQAEAAYAATCASVNSAVGQNAIQADIQAATSNSLAIDATFQSILNKLTFIDSENLNSGVLFAPTWSAIAQNWTNILWASRTTASNTAAYCTEFTTVIMPFVANLTGPIPPVLSVEVLSQYSTMADSLASAAQDTSEAFTTLNHSISAFTSTFQNFALKQKLADQQMIDQLNAEIATLQAQVDQYNTEISALAAALGVTVFGTITGVALFPEFAPIIIGVGLVTIAGEATAWGVLETERSNALSDISADQANLKTLQSELAAISAANSTLVTITNQTVQMGQQLGGFSAIWAAVKSDCTSVSQYITDLGSPTDQLIPQIFWATANNVNCVYQGMATGLEDYAIGIQGSGLPPPTSKRSLGGEEDFPTTLHAQVQDLIESTRARAKAHV